VDEARIQTTSVEKRRAMLDAPTVRQLAAILYDLRRPHVVIAVIVGAGAARNDRAERGANDDDGMKEP
jgi:hypothetical protein